MTEAVAGPARGLGGVPYPAADRGLPNQRER